MGSAEAPALYVAHDDTMAIVSALPLKVEGGKADTYCWGSVVEISPAERSERAVYWSQQGRSYAVLLALFTLVAASAAGVTWFFGLILLAGAGYIGAYFYGLRQRPGVISAPELERRRDEHHVLVADEDRKAFSDAVDIAQRTTRTWPALGDLIDVPVANGSWPTPCSTSLPYWNVGRRCGRSGTT